MTTLQTFNDVREHALCVQAELRCWGLSFAWIARKHGWSRGAVAQATPRNKAIDDELGVPQQELFPKRYDALGNRLHHVRQNTAGRGIGNGKNSNAA